MKKIKTLVVANWKMNPNSLMQAEGIFSETQRVARDLKNVTVVICPPFVYLNDLEKKVERPMVLGAQDVFWEKTGAFTGEISPLMLKKEGYVIIGHSERRELGETDDLVAKKILSAIKVGLKPIVCVGEKVRDDHGEYLHFLRSQIVNSLGKLPKRFLTKLIIAYEPIWAIGQTEDKAMKPAEIYEISLFIKKVLAEIFNLKNIVSIPILYGGSVSHNNALEIVRTGEVQGLLVGRESLNPKKFGELLKNLE